jgi:hypothetical protein
VVCSCNDPSWYLATVDAGQVKWTSISVKDKQLAKDGRKENDSDGGKTTASERGKVALARRAASIRPAGKSRATAKEIGVLMCYRIPRTNTLHMGS